MKKHPLWIIILLTLTVQIYSCKKSAEAPPAGAGAVPVLSAVTISAITQASASCAATVSTDGGAAVTFRGVCYGTSPDPTIAGTKTLDGVGTGNFVSSLKGLADGSRYYVRAYATNSNGTGYGPQKIFFALQIGELFQGGRLAYLLKDGDAGYAADVAHGLVASANDLGNYFWDYAAAPVETGSKGLALFTGAANTTVMVNKLSNSNPAKKCADLVEGGHDDWYLPSRDEMLKLYEARDAVGNFTLTTYYWTSSEAGASASWIQSFITGATSTYDKHGSFKVRAVRSF